MTKNFSQESNKVFCRTFWCSAVVRSFVLFDRQLSDAKNMGQAERLVLPPTPSIHTHLLHSPPTLGRSHFMYVLCSSTNVTHLMISKLYDLGTLWAQILLQWWLYLVFILFTITLNIEGMDLLRQLYVLAHWDGSCRSNLLSQFSFSPSCNTEYTDTGQARPCAEPIAPDAWHCSLWTPIFKSVVRFHWEKAHKKSRNQTKVYCS